MINSNTGLRVLTMLRSVRKVSVPRTVMLKTDPAEQNNICFAVVQYARRAIFGVLFGKQL